MMNQQYGYGLHPYYGGRNIYGGPMISPQTAAALAENNMAHQREIPKCAIGTGIVFLTLGFILILLGGLTFTGAIAGGTFIIGAVLLGFGAMMFIGGLMFILMACASTTMLKRVHEQTRILHAGMIPPPTGSGAPTGSGCQPPESGAPTGSGCPPPESGHSPGISMSPAPGSANPKPDPALPPVG